MGKRRTYDEKAARQAVYYSQVGRPSSGVYGYGMGAAKNYPQDQTHPNPYAQYQNLGAHANRYYGQSAPYIQTVPSQSKPIYTAPITSRPVQHPKRRKGPVIAIVIAVLAIVAAILLAFNMCTGQKSKRSGEAGQLDGKTPEEIQTELDRVVSEGMFNISIASVVRFENGSAAGDLRIENVPGNQYLMRVSIALDDTGQVVYTTDVIEQNHHIQRDTLDVVLPKGTYNATATFTALDPETEAEVGQAAAKVVLEVLS